MVAFEDWPKLKTEGIKAGRFPFGQIPGYEDDEVSGLVQMNAILRHIGRKFGATGEGASEQARVDMVMEAVEDARRTYLKLIYTEKLEADKLEEYAKMLSDTTVRGGGFLAQLERVLVEQSGSEGKFLATKKGPSVADYTAMDLVQAIVRIVPEALKPHEALANWLSGMEAREGIKKYIDSKPACREVVNGNRLG